MVRTAKGNAVTRNPARVLFAAEQLRTITYTAACQAIMGQWGIDRATSLRRSS